MDRRNMTRIIIEGALNGIGFVIGTAIFGLIASGFLLLLRHQVITFVALPVIGILLWLSVWGRRIVKARLEREKVEEFTRASRKAISFWRCVRHPRRSSRHALACVRDRSPEGDHLAIGAEERARRVRLGMRATPADSTAAVVLSFP
jgi:hypothetical protein